MLTPAREKILAEEGQLIDRELAFRIENAGVLGVYVAVNEKRIRVVGNQFVDAACYLDFDPLEVGINEHVYYPVLMDMLAQKEALSDDEFKKLLHDNVLELSPRHILPADIDRLRELPYGSALRHRLLRRYRPPRQPPHSFRRRAAPEPDPRRLHKA